MEFAQITLRITEDPKVFREFIGAYDRQDIDRWRSLVEEYELVLLQAALPLVFLLPVQAHLP